MPKNISNTNTDVHFHAVDTLQIPLAVVNKYLQHNCLRLNKGFIGEATITVPDTRILKPHLRCFVCCLLGSINIRTYRQSWGCATQGEWEVLWLLMRWRSQVPIIEMKAVSPERQELRETWKPPQPAQLNHHYLLGAPSCNPITAWENSCQPALKLKHERWRYKFVWMSKGCDGLVEL